MGRSTAGKSYLPIVQNADNFPYDRDPLEIYYQLLLAGDPRPHGYLRPETVAKMPWTASFEVSHAAPRTVTVLDASGGADSAAAFTAAFQALVDICIERDTFRLIAKKHSEPFAILSYPGPSAPATAAAAAPGGVTAVARTGTVTMERFMAPLFGILLQGAHMIAYVRSRATEDDCGVISGLWIPRRAKHLFSSPNMLDATVAGGIAAGTTALETIIKEAGEEASLPSELVRTRVRSTGLLSYVSSTDAIHGWSGESGLLCPGIVYTYDMELPVDVIPRPHDGEVGSYSLMSVGDVQVALLNNEFKPDAAVVVVDFLIRHGVINAENERSFVQINEHIHRRLPFRVAGG
ncbi:putative NUDIX domain-containing protein [Rosellinia necatrix]|uniref:Putative NUDIX domain-containing protein n=1 Tax=Rosellinia necatrix TaxID=77044 RepID=A0A1W2TC87_ROSNE|nr:putative NUDIX domain-containing protein [Rosellinia necatrix]